MSSETSITLVGNLAADPELRFTPNGHQVATLRLAVTPRHRDGNGSWADGETSWYRVTCWRHLAEHAAETLTKGDRTIVVGRLRIRQFETEDGRRGTVAEVDADDLGPSVRFAVAAVRRTANGGPPATDPQPASTPTPGAGDSSPFPF
jgi:single-strand DNA-binding protein